MLLPEVTRYLNHKLRLAQVSPYYQRPACTHSLQWAHQFRNWLRFCANNDERQIAHLVISCQHHLKNLLPAEANKSYQSSLNNYNKILTACKQLLGK